MKKSDFEDAIKAIDSDGLGLIVQLDPSTTKNHAFGGCFMVTTKIYDWGVMGYVQALGENGNFGRQSFYRAQWETFVLVGKPFWILKSPTEENANDD